MDNRTILVADDDPVFRELVAGLLEVWGLSCVVARDGTEAWDILLKPNTPRLAILDWMMPGVDGFEICRRLGSGSPAGAKIPHAPYVLLMTSRCNRDDLLKILVAGADDYLIKPFEPLDLKIRLRLGLRIVDLEAEGR